MVLEAKIATRRWLRALERQEERLPAAKKTDTQNVEHFLETPAADWFLTCGELAVTKAGSEAIGLWSEPLHQDGAASVLHCGLTVYGKRDVVFLQGEGPGCFIIYSAVLR